MKVLHISSSYNGGAGKAALNLHQALLDLEIESYFISLSTNHHKIPSYIKIKRGLIERGLSFLSSRFLSRISQKYFFSLWSLNANHIFNQIKSFQKDETILHIHNWYNIFSNSGLVKLGKMGYPIVFTFHDERLFTGGCHQTFECRKFTQTCQYCPQIPSLLHFGPTRNLQFMKKLHSSLTSVKYISPSKWIAREAEDSNLVPFEKIKWIPNISESKSIISKLDSNENRITIGIASIDPFSHLKGGNFVAKFQNYISASNENAKIVFLKDFKTGDHDLFWRKIDFLLVPSLIDNSPNVVHEAKAFGIPVIATQVGGIAEMLDLDFDITIEIDEENFDAILKKCTSLLTRVDFQEARSRMKQNYLNYLGDPLKNILEIYRELEPKSLR